MMGEAKRTFLQRAGAFISRLWSRLLRLRDAAINDVEQPSPPTQVQRTLALPAPPPMLALPAPAAAAATPPTAPPPGDTAPPAPRRPRTKRERQAARSGVNRKTLADLLGSIEGAMFKVRLPAERYSMIDHATRMALTRIGPLVLYSGRDGACMDRLDGPHDGSWSAHVFLALNLDDQNTEDRVYPAFFYAARRKSFSWRVEPANGVLYEGGMAYRGHKIGSDKLAWLSFAVEINKDTLEVRVLRFLIDRRVELPRATGRSARRGESYVRREWSECDWARTDTKGGSDAVRDTFVWGMNHWNQRADGWSVAVHKGRQRATFRIPDSDTKHYFADRGLHVGWTGQRKRIIHYVGEHQRIYADGRQVTVRAHMRGEREFDWHGYRCYVTSPRFHAWQAPAFDVPPDPADEIPFGVKTYSAPELAAMLADAEDMQRRPAIASGASSR
jgi:hypothetical protein